MLLIVDNDVYIVFRCVFIVVDGLFVVVIGVVIGVLIGVLIVVSIVIHRVYIAISQ